MSQPESFDVLEVAQSYYDGCGHAFLEPHPSVGQFYRITAFFDSHGDCPLCIEARVAVHEAMKEAEDV